ncbi:MAG: ClbS/DfsB family four-helix bundle protein [Bacteroidota bacterium]
MPVPKNKSELAEAIKNEFEKLKREIDSFPLERAKEKNFEGHKKDTLMSFHNLLSYLLGWGELVLNWNKKIVDNQDIEWPESGFKWTELGELAQKFYADYASMEIEELIERLVKNHGIILNLVASASEADLYDTAWYKHYPMGKMIQLNTSSPYKNACARIRKWKRQNI